MACEKCGKENDPANSYCRFCGSPLTKKEVTFPETPKEKFKLTFSNSFVQFLIALALTKPVAIVLDLLIVLAWSLISPAVMSDDSLRMINDLSLIVALIGLCSLAERDVHYRWRKKHGFLPAKVKRAK